MTLSKSQQTENQRLIRRKEVQAKTGLGASSIYALMKNRRISTMFESFRTPCCMD